MAIQRHEGPGLASDDLRDYASRRNTETAGPRHRILIVEDSAVVRIFLKHTLEDPLMESRVDAASDGLEALALIEASDYDLIVCDLNMPNMDGRRFCRAVRERGEKGLKQRIVVFTSDYHCRAEPQFSHDPALFFLQKPCSAEAIQGLFLRFME